MNDSKGMLMCIVIKIFFETKRNKDRFRRDLCDDNDGHT